MGNWKHRLDGLKKLVGPFQAINAVPEHVVLQLDLPVLLLLGMQKDIVQVLGDGVHAQLHSVPHSPC